MKNLLSVEEVALLKVTKEEKNPEKIKIELDEEVERMISNILVKKLRRSKAGKSTKSYKIPRGDVKAILDQMLIVTDSTNFEGLSTAITKEYQKTEYSRKEAVLFFLRIKEDSNKYIYFFKLPPKPGFAIIKKSLKALKRELSSYQKAFIYPNPTVVDEVKITQTTGSMKYMKRLLGIKEPPPFDVIAYGRVGCIGCIGGCIVVCRCASSCVGYI